MTPTTNSCLRDSAGRFRRGGGYVGWKRCPPDARLPSASLVPFGRRWHARGRWHCRGKPGRAPQHAQAYRGTLYRVSKHQSRRGRRTAQSSTSHGSARARESKAQIGGALRGKLILTTVDFLPTKSQQKAAEGQDSRGIFRECLGVSTAGYRIARQLRQLEASIAMDLGTTVLQFSLFLHDMDLRKLGLLIKID